MHAKDPRSNPRAGALPGRGRPWPLAAASALVAAVAVLAADAAEPERFNDDALVAKYRELEARGGLEAAILSPTLPKDPPQAAFLDALAWFAAGTPDKAGTLTRAQLDEFMRVQAEAYRNLLKAKVERGEANDYARTRTWKVIQKLTLLRDEMDRPARQGAYAYPAIARAPGGDDPWEREHTLRSPEEFGTKVCAASHQRPVLVKFGNTNCTQCMLFEMIGSVREIAESPAHKGSLDVYKVWFGFKPDASFAGKIRDPERLDDLAKAEGVRSSPSFIVYRNGRRYPCGDAFPDGNGLDEKLEACLRQEFGQAPVAAPCAPGGAAAPAGQGR